MGERDSYFKEAAGYQIFYFVIYHAVRNGGTFVVYAWGRRSSAYYLLCVISAVYSLSAVG